MIFQSFLLDINESNSYIIGSDVTRDVILIDAGEFSAPIQDYIEENNLRLNAVFITHDHYDHTNGIPDFISRYRVKIVSATGNAGHVTGHRVGHGDKIEIGDIAGEVLATPGHTHDSLSLAFPGVVFTGDALFAGSVGGTGSPEAAASQLDAIRRHIFTLPDDCEIFSGHGPASTVAIEKKYNPFFV